VTEITIKSGRGKPAKAALAEAEFALDVSNGTIYSKLDNGEVTALNTADFLGVNTDADNYQYWRYKVNGSSTVNVFSMQDLDFQAGDGIAIQQKGYGVEISALDGGWDQVSTNGFQCVANKRYMVSIADADPSVILPSLSPSDAGSYVVLSDAAGAWGNVNLTVNLNGTLGNQIVGQLILDLPSTIVTFLWDGNTWSVYTTAPAVDSP